MPEIYKFNHRENTSIDWSKMNNSWEKEFDIKIKKIFFKISKLIYLYAKKFNKRFSRD